MKWLILSAFILPTLFGYGQEVQSLMSPKSSIVEHIVHQQSFTPFMIALKNAGLSEAFAGDGPFTLFIPLSRSEPAADSLMWGSKTPPHRAAVLDLVAKLGFCAIRGKILPRQLNALIRKSGGVAVFQTLQGQAVKIFLADGQLTMEDPSGTTARILTSEVCSNGLIYGISTVLSPTAE